MPYVETRDGTKLYYLDGGRGKPLVFVSSAWLSSRMWEFQLQPLDDAGFRCIALDRRGHGRSDWTWNGYDYDTLADDVAALLDHLDVRDAMLIGHSAGCGEVVHYLARHGSARVDRIALVSGTTPFPMKTADNPDGVDRSIMEMDLAARTRDRPQWFATNADSFLGVGQPGVEVSAPFARFMIEQCLDCSAKATRDVFLTAFETDLREDLRRITVATLIVHGDADVQAPLPICGAKAAALVPGCRFIVYQHAAHGLFVTHAARLNADLQAFAST